VRGSRHAKFKHAKAKGSVIINRDEGDDARPYEEKQVRKAVEAAKPIRDGKVSPICNRGMKHFVVQEGRDQDEDRSRTLRTDSRKREARLRGTSDPVSARFCAEARTPRAVA
jgi:hypothetical protein